MDNRVSTHHQGPYTIFLNQRKWGFGILRGRANREFKIIVRPGLRKFGAHGDNGRRRDPPTPINFMLTSSVLVLG